VPWLLRAKSAEALREQAARLRDHLAGHPLDPVDVGFSLATTRTAFEHRAAVVAADPADLLRGLAAVAAGDEPGRTAVSGRTAFLFSGQGSQRAGMGRRLAAVFPAFAGAWREVADEFDRHLDRPLDEVVADAELLRRTEYAQPALFAVEVALVRLLAAWGLRPDLLLGHSVGELVAAHVAGVLDLPDAAALVAARGAVMQAVPRRGAMVSIRAGEEEVLASIAGRGHEVSVAAVNGPASTVVSGDAGAVEEVAAHWAAAGRKTARLRVDHAFHSPHLDGATAGFREVAERVRYRRPTTAVVEEFTAEHWVRHVREAVRFADGVRALRDAGARRFVEVGPDAVLSALAGETAPDVPAVPTSRRDEPEELTVVRALASAHAAGAGVDWAAFFGPGATAVPLPTYPFRHRRHWVSPPSGAPVVSGVDRPAAGEAGSGGTGSGETGPGETGPGGSGSRESGEQRLIDLIRAHAAAVLGHDAPDSIGPDDNFLEIGFSSFTALEVRNRLCEVTGLELSPVVLYDHPTPATLEGHLREKLTDRA
jgi:acyl transferase domain-containing protein